MNVGTLQAVLTANTTQFTAAMGKAQQTLTAFSTKARAVGMKMTSTFTLIGAAVGTMAFNAAKDFDASLKKIEGLVGVNGKVVQKWGKDIIDMAPKLGKAPKALADAMFFITSAGMRGSQALDVLKQSAKASVAGLGEVKVIADLATSAINAYGKANLSVSRAMDVLAATVREGKAEAPELTAALGQVLPIASAMGVSFDQVGAAIAGMTRTGTEARTAAMQLKNILNAILKPTERAEKFLNKMGTSSQQLRDKLKNDGLIATLVQLKTMLGKFGESAVAKVFPNIRALSGVLDLLGSNAEDNIGIFQRVANASGDMADAFKVSANSIQHRWEQFKSSWGALMTGIGLSLSQSLLPILNNIRDAVQGVLQWWQNLSEGTQQTIIKFGMVVTAAGPVLLILSAMVSAVTALLSPVGLLVAGLGLLGGAWALNALSAQKVTMETETFNGLIKKTNEYTREAAKQIAIEQGKVNLLFGALQQANISQDTRKRLIKEINDKYSQYLPHLLTEKSTLEDIKTAQENVNAAFEKKIALQMMEKEMTALTTKYVDAKKAISNINVELAKLQQQLTTASIDKGEDKAIKNQITTLQGLLQVYQDIVDKYEVMKKKAIEAWQAAFPDLKTPSTNPNPTTNPSTNPNPNPNPTNLGGETPKYIEELQFQIELLGKSQAEQMALNIAREHGVSVDSEAYKNILALTTAYQAQITKVNDLKTKEQEEANVKKTLGEQVKAIEQTYMSEVEKVRAAYQARIDIVNQAMHHNVISVKKAGELIKLITDDMNKHLTNIGKGGSAWLKTLFSDTQTWVNYFAQGLNLLGTAFGKMMSGQKGAWRDLVTFVIRSINQIITAYLVQAVLGLTAQEVSKKGIIGLAIAAVGTAALGAIWASYSSKLAGAMEKGGDVTKTGTYLVGEKGPELVNLKSGDHVTPAGETQNILQQALTAMQNTPQILSQLNGRHLQGVNTLFKTSLSLRTDMAGIPRHTTPQLQPYVSSVGAGNVKEQLVAEVHGEQIDFILRRWQENNGRVE